MGSLLDPKIGPKSNQKSSNKLAAATYPQQTTPRGPKSAPRGPKTSPRELKEAKSAPETVPRGPKIAPRQPKTILDVLACD